MPDSPHDGPAQLAPPPHPPSMPPSSYQEAGTRSRKKEKLGLFRKRSTPTPDPIPPTPPVGDNDEWLVEGESRNGHVNATVSVGREASTLSRSAELLPADDAQTSASTQSSASTHLSSAAATEHQPEKRLSKSRTLAKKTSRLFQRTSNGSHKHHSEDDAAVIRRHQQSGRQSSFSSTASETGSSRNKHWSLSRASTNSSPRASPETHQPSSWHPSTTFTLRRSSSVSYHSHSKPPSEHSEPTAPQTTPQGLRHRDSAQFHNSTGGGTIRGSNGSTLQRADTVSSRMSSWLTNIMPTSNGPDAAAASPAPAPAPAPYAEQGTPSQPQQVTTSSPLRRPQSIAASIFSAARNKAASGMRYLLDSDAQPDHCQDTMWVMGVGHPGWTPRLEDTPIPESEVLATPPRVGQRTIKGKENVQSTPPQARGLGNIFGSSMNIGAQANAPATPPSDPGVSRLKKDRPKEVLTWPDHFYDDFKSRVWCTYREQYAPILSMPHDQLIPNAEAYFGAFAQNDGLSHSQTMMPSRQSGGAGAWGWVKGGERGLTSDAGWGCMLRTGQSMLANALIHLHLGRGWRVPAQKPSVHPRSPLELAELEAYSTYVRVLSWFMDDPSPLCPFSVHRFALIGKELGKEVGEWFGPSTAAGALKTLANSFPPCGLSVVSAADGSVFRSEVYQASNLPTDWTAGAKPSRPNSYHRMSWGGKAVLIVIPTRLGLDGVNPMYYDDIKALFTWPQSVGIAGGRPSSSYYFVASQANSLFYLDPHFTRPAVPLRVPPTPVGLPPPQLPRSAQRTPCTSAPHSEVSADIFEEREEEEERGDDVDSLSDDVHGGESSLPRPRVDVVNVDHESRFETRHPLRRDRRFNPSQPLRVPSTPPPRESRDLDEPTTPTLSAPHGSPQQSPFASPATHARYSSTDSSIQSSPSRAASALPVDPQTSWYASAYSETALKTFHCDRVKKLPLSGLDPSMLLGFLCTNEAEFEDFCERVSRLPHKFFNVQDEPPIWSDAESGLESVSEPDPDSDGDFNDDDFEDDGDMEFGRMGHRYVSNATVVPRYSNRHSQHSQHSHTFSTSTTSSRGGNASHDVIGALSSNSSDDFDSGSVETPMEHSSRPLPSIATIQLDDDESFEQQQQQQQPELPPRLPSSQTLRAFPRLSADGDSPQQHIIPPPRKRSLTALSSKGPAGVPSKPLPVIMQHADLDTTPKQTHQKTDSQGSYNFPKDETVRDLASTARGDSPELKDEESEGPLSPTLRPVAAQADASSFSAAPPAHSDEGGDDDEEDSLVIIDKDSDDELESTRNSAGVALDRTELESVPELSPVTHH